jgi:cytochrome c biogenesis protein CcdA/thiol-disulfide isomerase/thioredoxin
MLLLLGFAFLAGAGTALSPCVLPVLPAVLSASGAGGRRRPLGVVLGLTVTFTITIVGIAEVVGGVGLGTDPLRALAVVVLAGFGIALLFPSVAARLEAPLARLSRYGPRTRGDGFASGVLVGAALGLVYTPCAGPILAAVITVSAASGRSVAVAIAYAVGSAAVLLVLCLGGRRVLDRVRAAGRGPLVQRVMGAVMLATALLIVTNVDVSFDQFVARKIPEVSLTASLERSGAVAKRLHEINTRKAKFTTPVPAGVQADAKGGLPKLGAAPDFTDTQRWFNTPGGRPETLAALRRRGAVLVDFWTYTCINCLRTLPYLEAWDRRYRDQGLTIVGVHTPEFAFEHDAGNVADAIRRLGIRYPVVQDNQMGTWNAYANQYWPADYLIDSTGQVRYASIGEGDYDKTEAAIRSVLAEHGRTRLGADARPKDVVVPSMETSPETYLGTARAQGWVAGQPKAGRHVYPGVQGELPINVFAYGGEWTIGRQAATTGAGATIDAEVQAKHVYLVLGSAGGRPRQVQVLLDGRPVTARQAGADVHGGRATVTGQRLYTLVSLPDDEQHRLTLRFAPGISGFAFTFG